MSHNPLCTGRALKLRPHSADLVPVFSFGENDVRLLALFFLFWPAFTPYTVTH